MITMPNCSSPNGSGRRLAQLGRAKLRTDMTTPGVPTGCDCPRCCPPPLNDIEAQAALRHVSNADAVAFAQSRVTLASYYGCDYCGAWVPMFTEVPE